MDSQAYINEFLESIAKLPLDDQQMISDIIQKRVIEARRKELSDSVKESREEYLANKTGRGSVEEFLTDIKDK